MLRDFNFKNILPVFSENEKKDLEIYYVLSKEYEREIEEKAREEFEKHPMFGPLIRNIPLATQLKRRIESDKLIRDAIYNNAWEPYVKYLMQQGVQYANMGLDFRSCHEMLSMVKRYFTPILKKLYEIEPERIRSANNGMILLFDFAIGVVGESFIYERNRVIEQQNKKLEGTIKELESFAYIISHDLKTPLRGIASLSDWIKQDYSDKLDDTGKEYIDLLKSRVVRLEALIDGVLAYSRAGKTDLEIDLVDINELIKDVTEMLVPPDNVQIKIDNQLPKLTVIKSAMVQIFSNLIGNAIKHNDKKDVIINIGCIEKKDDWWFYVKDNGPGIEKEYHDKIFQIFQTLKTKDEMNSTGIGLSLVKKIIDNIHGKIWIESAVNKGATFFFTIKK